MSDTIRFILDGREVTAASGETIWQASARHGTDIPHLCYRDSDDYRADGNCRACMVEIEGERVLAASCIRTPTEGMVVHSENHRAKTARKMVMELLVADQPSRDTAHDPDSELWRYAETQDVDAARFPAKASPAPDSSHPAIAVNMDACIQCNLCVRACREVQVNDVIGLAGRGADADVPQIDPNKLNLVAQVSLKKPQLFVSHAPPMLNMKGERMRIVKYANSCQLCVNARGTQNAAGNFSCDAAACRA